MKCYLHYLISPCPQNEKTLILTTVRPASFECVRVEVRVILDFVIRFKDFNSDFR